MKFVVLVVSRLRVAWQSPGPQYKSALMCDILYLVVYWLCKQNRIVVVS